MHLLYGGDCREWQDGARWLGIGIGADDASAHWGVAIPNRSPWSAHVIEPAHQTMPEICRPLPRSATPRA